MSSIRSSKSLVISASKAYEQSLLKQNTNYLGTSGLCQLKINTYGYSGENPYMVRPNPDLKIDNVLYFKSGVNVEVSCKDTLPKFQHWHGENFSEVLVWKASGFHEVFGFFSDGVYPTGVLEAFDSFPTGTLYSTDYFSGTIPTRVENSRNPELMEDFSSFSSGDYSGYYAPSLGTYPDTINLKYDGPKFSTFREVLTWTSLFIEDFESYASGDRFTYNTNDSQYFNSGFSKTTVVLTMDTFDGISAGILGAYFDSSGIADYASYYAITRRTAKYHTINTMHGCFEDFERFSNGASMTTWQAGSILIDTALFSGKILPSG